MGGLTATSAPALAGWNGAMRVYATAGGKLRRWDYDIFTDTWTMSASPEQWTDGTDIVPNATTGIGLTSGYLYGESSGRLFAAIPEATPYSAAGSYLVDFARQESTGVWYRYPSTIFGTPSTYVLVQARPALAYMPFSRSNTNFDDGRFYLVWNQPNFGVLMKQSQGNRSSSPRALDFSQPAFYLWNEWQTISGAPSLLFEAGQDDNLREAHEYAGNSSIMFLPIADGVVHRTLSDTDDWSVMAAHLACSLTNTPSSPTCTP